MSVLLQISDTHFGTEQPQVVEALVALAAQQRPEVVVLSGDITQRARPAQFRAAKAFVDRLGAPVLAIPGNHDIALFDLWARLTRPYARYAKVFGADLEPVHSSPDLLVVGVNTTRKWRHKNGEVSTAQIDRVAKLLDRGQPAAVARGGGAPANGRDRGWRPAGSLARPPCRPADLVGRRGRPRVGRAHPSALHAGAARSGAATMGGPGRHRRLVAHTP
jgi:hypothetical protein